jgi:hypothetical protein
MGHLKVAHDANVPLLQPVVLRLLVLDVFSDYGFDTPHGGDEKPASPQALANEILFPFSIHAGDLFPLMKPTTCDLMKSEFLPLRDCREQLDGAGDK